MLKLEPISNVIDKSSTVVPVDRIKAFIVIEPDQKEANEIKMVCHVFKWVIDEFKSTFQAFEAFKESVKKEKAYKAIILSIHENTVEDYVNFVKHIRNYERGLQMDETQVSN